MTQEINRAFHLAAGKRREAEKAAGEKRCSKCDTVKSLSDFYKDTSTLDRLTAACKPCRNAALSKWRDGNQRQPRRNSREYPTFLVGQGREVGIWRSIPGYEGRYEIDASGNVWSCKTKRLMTHLLYRGYEKVCLRDGNKPKNTSVARILANVFIPNPNHYPMINHIDGNKRNNSIENLEWCDASRNSSHAYMLGLNGGEKHCRSKFTISQVKEMRQRLANGERAYVLAREYGVSQNAICAIRHRRTWKYV